MTPAAGAPAAAQAIADQLVPLHATVRSHGSATPERRSFRLEIPAAGLLVVEVSSPEEDGVQATLLDLSEDGRSDSGLIWLERLPHRWVGAAASPSNWRFAVVAQDPERPLGRFKLHTDFIAAGDAFLSPTKKDEDEREIEIEPPTPSPTATEGFRLGSGGLCRRAAEGSGDDHGDRHSCATPLEPGLTIAAQLRDPWGDDEDVFVFRLEDLDTVSVKTTGTTDTLGSLYDERGQRLALDDDGGTERNFRIVKTLGPGLYFVEVEGSHAAEGDYRLVLTSLR